MSIVIGADPFAVKLKQAIITHLKQKGMEVIDADSGEELPYYESAQRACRLIRDGKADRGILLCGTGMGMSIVANKFEGITAACVESVFTAGMCSAINNANVITMGAMVVGEFMALQMVDAWLNTEFTAGLEQYADFLRNAVARVGEIDKDNRK